MPTYASVVLAQSPGRYYQLDSSTADTGAAGVALTLGASTAAPSYVGGGSDSTTCLSFDGSNDYAYSGSVAWASNAATITGWLKPTSFASTQVWFETGANYNTATTTGAGFLVYSDGSNLQVGMVSSGGVTYDSATFPLPSTGVWTHVAFVFDRSASTTGRMKVYYNGAAQTASSPTWQTNTGNFQLLDLYVMCRGGFSFFQGTLLDDLALWNSALSSGQVSAQYNYSVVATGPVARRRRPIGLYTR